MSNSKQTTEKPASEQAILKALAASPDATAAEVAAAANVGRSTAGKVLARLASAGEVRRTEGGRDGARRLPDRFALTSAEPAAKAAKPKAAAATEPKALGDRLKPGQLDGLVLAYLSENAGGSPHGPTTVAKALERSSGAVSNCLTRLTKDKQVSQDNDKPRRYSLRQFRRAAT
jgi:DNA-binding MarR family transcriptional regulator